ncbi:MAG TPA: type II secretion system F family protein [Deltaproteobacteria bacterium]|nr:type II secretion system F family protein [Deltaproteobacteria bacterium]
MATFRYKAVDADGVVVRGSIEGTDEEAALNSIVDSGLYVISLYRPNELLNAVVKRISAYGVRRRDVIELAKSLSVMLRAGIPIIAALEDLETTAENRYMGQTVGNIRRLVEMGSSFSDALAQYREIFPDIFIRLARVGEETGSLDRSLYDVSVHLQRMEELYSSLKRALIYPVFALITTFGSLIFWLAYVLPQVLLIFEGMRLDLPPITRTLLVMSGLTRSYWFVIPILPFVLVLLYKLLRMKPETRYYTDALLIRFPILRQILYNKLLALFCEQQRILAAAGVPITRSLEIVSEVIGNEVFRQAIYETMRDISVGSRISDAMRKHRVFPVMVTRMVDIGETSGSLDEQYAYLADHYIEVLDDVSQKIGKLVEPVVIVVVGVMFGVIIMGLLLPVYELVTTVG